jgi:hypothetical protein
VTANYRKEGTVQYSGRAFHQDATDAMRDDIVRGLIELITNSDDAYAALDDNRCGKIVVEVEHRRNQPWKVVVRDRASGMSAETMEQRLTRLGGRTSGFESGHDRRGNLGRGAKDLAAFGDVTFSSICDDRLSRLILRANSTWELTERDATSYDRAELGVNRGNGTVVEVEVAESIRCPRHDTLKRKLATHYQLRDILDDPMRRVELVNLNDRTRDRITYEYPDLPTALEEELEIPGYEGVSARLIIWKHPVRYDEGPDDTGRSNGILIKGQRAIYDNTLFSFEGNVHAGWFSGKLTCQHIDHLARQYDDRLNEDLPQDPTNPMPIISRRREGLNPNHPFVEALKEAVERPLGELVAEEAERARREGGNIESEETRAALDRLAREVSRLINEEMQEIEADELPPYGGEGEPPPIAIVPGEAFAYMGEDRTLTVAARNEGVAVGDEVQVEVEPGGVVELLTPTVRLNASARREDILVGQIRLRPLLSGDVTVVTARMPDRYGEALIEVRPARDVIEEEIVPPETLEFERPSYRVGWQRKKELAIAAPVELVAEQGYRVRVSSSDPGVVVRTPASELEYDDSVEFYRASIEVEARVLNAKSVITARSEEITATTHVAVTRKEESPGFRVQLVDEEWGNYRAIIESEPLETGGEVQVIKIAGRHPSLRPFLGEESEGQNTQVCRTLMAEAAADVTARFVVNKLYYLRRTIEPFDSDRIYREHYKRVSRFLPRFLRLLVGDPKAVRSSESLAPSPFLATATERSVSAT